MASVDVCMPAYNAAEFVEAAVKSVLAQTYGDFNLIVVDDGSTDGTWLRIQALAATDSRIRAYRNSDNAGVAVTRNRLLSLGSAPFVALADADDFCMPNRLQTQISFLYANPDVGVVGSAVEFQGDGNRAEASGAFYADPDLTRFFLMFGPCVWNTTTVYRRDLLSRVGGYSENFARGAEDYDLWTRLSVITQIVNLDDSLVRVTLHGSSLTAVRRDVDVNILRVSARCIGAYIGQPVSEQEASEFHQLIMCGALDPDACARGLRLLELIHGQARTRESDGVVSEYRRMVASALWAQSTYKVYDSRLLSIRLYVRSARAKPSVAFRNLLWLAPRLLAPKSARRLLKRAFGSTIPASGN